MPCASSRWLLLCAQPGFFLSSQADVEAGWIGGGNPCWAASCLRRVMLACSLQSVCDLLAVGCLSGDCWPAR